MSRRLAILTLLALGLTAGAANAAESPDLARLTGKAEACIRAAVPSVERVEPSLADGVTFIVHDLCAVELGNRQRYIQNSALIETMKDGGPFGAMIKAMPDDPKATPEQKADAEAARKMMIGPYDKARLDPDTGEIVYPDGATPGFFGNAFTNIATTALGNEPDPRMRALTARLLLDARLARKP
ncbi:hypothetical protein QO010_004003 [Caulobacter ginsengisoli]|uniref:Uncharacterized protein n=1 Tax=Caulobacter ginsengisoli TaxID=400775 RepID=A0ABU0IW12_9CAUL|nr:hypothetical protein [Caulobacter ginsengisoli]MDQ0466210.1 hypothetical protein [Caulobacter ginsengisoli]